MIRTTIKGTIIHLAAWWISFGAVYSLFSLAPVSPARHAYADICAWWASLYVGYLASVSLPAFLGSLLVTFIYLQIARDPFHAFVMHDFVADWDFWSVVQGVGAAGFNSSPIVVNFVVRQGIRWFRRRSAAR